MQVVDEDSLQPITEKMFPQSDPSFTFVNFNLDDFVISNNPNCDKRFCFFILKTDGSSQTLDVSLEKYRYRIRKGDIAYSRRVPEQFLDYLIMYRKELINVYKKNYSRKIASSSRYHSMNKYRDEEDGPILCKFLKKPFTSTYAVNCKYYHPDSREFTSSLSSQKKN